MKIPIVVSPVRGLRNSQALLRRTAGLRERLSRRAGYRGFSLVELMISMVVLSIVLGSLMQFMSMLQRRYTQATRSSGLSQAGKSISGLLAMDIGQAGYYPGINTTAPAAISSTGAQTVTLSSTMGIYPGSVILVGIGTNQEAVRLTAVDHTSNQVTGLFKMTHSTPVPVAVRLSEVPYPAGILAPVTRDPSTGTFLVNTNGSNATTLKLLGDFRGNGTLRYIEYRYASATSSTTACATPPCAIWRSDSCVPGTDPGCTITTQTAPVPVAENLMNTATPGLFRYFVLCRSGSALPSLAYVTYMNSSIAPGVSPCPSVGDFYVLGVEANLQFQTQRPVERGAGGPVTIQVRQTFVPRNIRHALEVALDSLQDLLPAKPASVPLAP